MPGVGPDRDILHNNVGRPAVGRRCKTAREYYRKGSLRYRCRSAIQSQELHPRRPPTKHGIPIMREKKQTFSSCSSLFLPPHLSPSSYFHPPPLLFFSSSSAAAPIIKHFLDGAITNLSLNRRPYKATPKTAMIRLQRKTTRPYQDAGIRAFSPKCHPDRGLDGKTRRWRATTRAAESKKTAAEWVEGPTRCLGGSAGQQGALAPEDGHTGLGTSPNGPHCPGVGPRGQLHHRRELDVGTAVGSKGCTAGARSIIMFFKGRRAPSAPSSNH